MQLCLALLNQLAILDRVNPKLGDSIRDLLDSTWIQLTDIEREFINREY